MRNKEAAVYLEGQWNCMCSEDCGVLTGHKDCPIPNLCNDGIALQMALNAMKEEPEYCRECIHYNIDESECMKDMTPAWSEEQEAWECDAHKDADQYQYEMELKKEVYEERYR